MGMQCSVLSPGEPKYQVMLTDEVINQLKKNQPQYQQSSPVMAPSPMYYPTMGLPHYPHHPACVYSMQPYFQGMPICACIQQPPPSFVRPISMCLPEVNNATKIKSADQKFKDIAELAKHSPWLAEEFYKRTVKKDSFKSPPQQDDKEIKNQEFIKMNPFLRKVVLMDDSKIEKHETVPPPEETIFSLAHRSILLPEPKIIKKLPLSFKMLKKSNIEPIFLSKKEDTYSKTLSLQDTREKLSEKFSEKLSGKLSEKLSEKLAKNISEKISEKSKQLKQLVNRSFSEIFAARKSDRNKYKDEDRDQIMKIETVKMAIKASEIPQLIIIDTKREMKFNKEARPEHTTEIETTPTLMTMLTSPKTESISFPRATVVSPPKTFESKMYTIDEQSKQLPPSTTMRLSQAVAFSRSLPDGSATRLEKTNNAYVSMPTLSKAAMNVSTTECAITKTRNQMYQSTVTETQNEPKSADEEATNK